MSKGTALLPIAHLNGVQCVFFIASSRRVSHIPLLYPQDSVLINTKREQEGRYRRDVIREIGILNIN